MSRRKIYLYTGFMIIVFFIWSSLASGENEEEFTERAKISVRDVGHQLLLANNDSTSLVLPIIKFNNSTYILPFEESLSFEPSRLVSIIENALNKGGLPEHYRVEVIQCEDYEVSYSYEMSASEESTIIPCVGRYLPKKCYTIKVKFTQVKAQFFSKEILLYIMFLISIVFLMDVLYNKRKQTLVSTKNKDIYASIGSFQFYPEQNKLVKAAREISLSKKECELLAIFVANPNQIIKRDELMKKVWEDNGVIVGRSLDTYISKLRKKLKADDTIKITNIHGVGYKLEIH